MNKLSLLLFSSVLMPTAFAQSHHHEKDQIKIWSAADGYWDQQRMDRSQQEVLHHHGGMAHFYSQADRLELKFTDDETIGFLEGQGWYGTDENRLWVKVESEYSFDHDEFEEFELQALWSKPISPYFDLQAGLRHDRTPDNNRSFAVLGLQGLAPMWFEVDVASFISEDGDFSIEAEAEYELKLTQRLELQPRIEVGYEFQSVPEHDLGSGFSEMEAGLRLIYSIKPEIAPYFGVEWEEKLGRTGDIAQQNGGEKSSTSFVVGLRMWY